jgi:hypothetical protein
MRRVLLCSLPGLVLSGACLLPYMNKAFTIDDPFFLLQAHYILMSPLHPARVEICWGYDNLCGPVAGIVPNNPLMSYLLVPVVVTGGHEWMAHSLQLLMLWVGIAATVSLALRFDFGNPRASAAGVILASTPPVLAFANTAMPDILAMVLGVVGIERLVVWRQERNSIHGLFSALALGLAAFARMHMLLLWPCAALLLRDDGRFWDIKGWLALRSRWWPVVGAVLVFGIASALTHEPGTTGGPTQRWISADNINGNFRAYLLDWILAMPLGLAWLVFRGRRAVRRLMPWLLITCCMIVVWKAIRNLPLLHLRWELLCALLGMAILIDLFLWAFKSQEQRRIFCALWLLLPLAALGYFHLPVKYLVVCAPAVALLSSEILFSTRWAAGAVAGVSMAGVVFSLLVLQADADFAEMGREAAMRLVAPHAAAGQRVWLVSQWGFQWYALKAGARLLLPHDLPARGDYLVRGKMEGKEIMKSLPPATLVQKYSIGGPGGRTMSMQDNAGLYSNYFGVLMWAWGSGEWNRYELWQFR